MTTSILEGHHDEVWNLNWSPDGRYLASGGKDGAVCIWRVEVCVACLVLMIMKLMNMFIVPTGKCDSEGDGGESIR